MTQSLHNVLQQKRLEYHQQININDYEPLKIGLHYRPPMIMIEYMVPSTGKLFHHKIRLENLLQKKFSIEKILKYCRYWHTDYLSKYDDFVLQNLLTILQEKYLRNLESDQEESDLIANKERKNERVIQSAIVDTKKLYKNQEEYNNNEKESEIEDETNKMTNQDQENSNKNFDQQLPEQINFTQQLNANPQNITPNFSKLNNEQLDYQKFDLNKLTTEELNQEKAKMDKVFLQNQKKPGEDGFVYDIQVEFQPYKNNEWDDDDDW